MTNILNQCVCCGAAIPEGHRVCPKCEYNAGQQLYRKLEQLNAKIKSGQLVEVVRCKDCFWYDTKYGECKNESGLNRDVSENGYCYSGEQRKELK